MPKTLLTTVVKHCDALLRTNAIGDYDGAVNGLQAGNSGSVTRIAAAVDASLATVKLAIAARADLLIVHHGLFWSPAHPWTGKKYELSGCWWKIIWRFTVRICRSTRIPGSATTRNSAPRWLKNLRPFFVSHGQPIGFQSRARISRAELAAKLRARPARNRESFPAAGKFPAHRRGDRRRG